MGEKKRGGGGQYPDRSGSRFARIWNPNRRVIFKTYDGTVYQVQDNGSWKKKGVSLGGD